MRKLLTRLCMILFSIAVIFCMAACSSSEGQKVITNMDKAEEITVKNIDETASLEEQGDKSSGDIEKEAEVDKEASGAVKNSGEDNTAKDEQISEQQDKKEENKEGSKTEAGQYKGYKGPVQGEIKYKEGTPAAKNSNEYKASGDIESPYHVDLIVTRDFGHKKMYADNVGLVKDEVGMEVLFRNLDIQTAYGGGFVNSINGLESGYTFFTGAERKKQDWFYWVNGILAPVGVAEYRPQPGDAIWWDYHDWSVSMFLPAIIGSYPQPFKNGFWGKNPGTVIMYTEEYKEQAEKLKGNLNKKGVKQIDTALYDPDAIKAPKKYYIVLGIWDKLQENSSLLKDINKKNKLIGVYAKFDDEKVKALNFKGKEISVHESGGAIYAFGSSIGSLNPLWLVTGTDDNGFKLAFDTILNHPQKIKGLFGAIISEDGVENIPYAK